MQKKKRKKNPSENRRGALPLQINRSLNESWKKFSFLYFHFTLRVSLSWRIWIHFDDTMASTEEFHVEEQEKLSMEICLQDSHFFAASIWNVALECVTKTYKRRNVKCGNATTHNGAVWIVGDQPLSTGKKVDDCASSAFNEMSASVCEHAARNATLKRQRRWRRRRHQQQQQKTLVVSLYLQNGNTFSRKRNRTPKGSFVSRFLARSIFFFAYVSSVRLILKLSPSTSSDFVYRFE